MMFVSSLSSNIAAMLLSDYRAQLGSVTKEEMAQKVQSTIEASLPAKFELSSTDTDYETILFQLMNEIERNPEWFDTITSGTGQTLLRKIAAGVSLEVNAIERAVQETFFDTANNDSSLRIGARSLGVHIRRRTSSVVPVTLVRSAGYSDRIWVIPPYSTFGVDSAPFFNRDAIVFNEGSTTVTADLYEGQVKTAQVLCTGVKNQVVEIGEELGDISDNDLRVSSNGTSFKVVTDGLWNYGRDEPAVYENTLANTNVELVFGDDMYGKAPRGGDSIDISWVVTKGQSGDDGRSNLPVTISSIDGIVLEQSSATQGPAISGSDAHDASFYRVHAPHIRAAKRTAVTRQSHIAITVDEYPGVFDAVMRGQAETNPTKRSYTNIVEVTLLTEDIWSTIQWQNYVRWLTDRSVFRCEFVRKDPTVVLLNVDATVYCFKNAPLDTVKDKLISHFTTAFKPRRFSIGYSHYLTDLAKMLRGPTEISEWISHSVILNPTQDTIAGPLDYIKLNTLNITTQYTDRVGVVEN